MEPLVMIVGTVGVLTLGLASLETLFVRFPRVYHSVSRTFDRLFE